jgi:thymidylate synthase ThyX
MMTKFLWTGTKESYDRFFQLRTKPDAQLEIQEVAQQIKDLIVYQEQKPE